MGAVVLAIEDPDGHEIDGSSGDQALGAALIALERELGIIQADRAGIETLTSEYFSQFSYSMTGVALFENGEDVRSSIESVAPSLLAPVSSLYARLSYAAEWIVQDITQATELLTRWSAERVHGMVVGTNSTGGDLRGISVSAVTPPQLICAVGTSSMSVVDGDAAVLRDALSTLTEAAYSAVFVEAGEWSSLAMGALSSSATRSQKGLSRFRRAPSTTIPDLAWWQRIPSSNEVVAGGQRELTFGKPSDWLMRRDAMRVEAESALGQFLPC